MRGETAGFPETDNAPSRPRKKPSQEDAAGTATRGKPTLQSKPPEEKLRPVDTHGQGGGKVTLE